MAECMTPYLVRDNSGTATTPVPCGKCPSCVSRRASAWSFRLMQEEKRSTSAHFLTLTYDTSHVPITSKGFMSISKRELPLFMKRLRKRHGSTHTTPLKYYGVGEYGSKGMRPHYHMILFNAELEHIQPAWDLGDIHYGTVTGASIGYTLKYMSKRKKIPLHKNDDRVPEFSLMSKRLGANYLTDAMIAWHEADMYNRMYCNLTDGKKISMPRYYKDKIYTKEQREHIGAFQASILKQKQIQAELEGGEDYWRNRREAEKAAFRRMEMQSKKGDKL